ncbi:auxin response factor 17 isoform X1 [Dendrobium catenatum]|uniref:Auxin response factor n=1 Tax=Dendrobium catenatum TaxID=906689 RepID=A0A2I0WIE2_9ASPA|nr:auxin response factor 17 isoform X1 [Dendrobium catenatum]PKU75398.1 Auxin response factor 17 [Dendrobium catenatum]
MLSSRLSRSLDYSIWKACAGGSTRLPAIGSGVFYFPEGHAEHATSPPDFSSLLRFPSFFQCNVTGISLLANQHSDEVYAQISLDPRPSNAATAMWPDDESSVSSFAKVLTPSDANNGGGLSVPRFCAESMFPPLDHMMDPPFQTIYVLDVHGKSWKFRHIYRGTPRRHLLTSGWSDFVNTKKLISGDTVVFIRNLAGELFVGIRRTGRSYGGQISLEGGGFKDEVFLRNRGRVLPESVIEAVRLADMGKPFEVLFYPMVGLLAFVVAKEMVEAAMVVPWGPGMRIKMAVESGDSSRTTWLQGTISCAAVPERGRWARSLWRMLEIKWDEQDVLQGLRAVNPWQVELISSVLPFHVMKKLKLTEGLKVLVEGHGNMTFSITGFGGTGMQSLIPAPYNISESPSGKQGARHIFSSLSSSLVPRSTNQVLSDNIHGFDNAYYPNVSRSDGITQVVKEVIHHNGVEIASACKTTMKSRKGSIQLFGQVIETEQLDDRNVSTEFPLSFTHKQLLDKQIRVSAVGECK